MRIITGLHAIDEYLKKLCQSADSDVVPAKTNLYVAKTSQRIEKILERASEAGTKVHRISPKELDLMAGKNNHRGAALEIPRVMMSVESLRSFLETSSSRTSLVVVLDGITDPHNLGAILRSADQFGVDLVIVPGRRSAQLNDTVYRTSAGAATQVPFLTVANLTRAIVDLKEAGYWVYGADIDGNNVTSAKMSDRAVLVLGSEDKGLNRLVRDTCDLLIRIPAFGTVDSLNVSVAAGIILFETRRQQGLFEE